MKTIFISSIVILLTFSCFAQKSKVFEYTKTKYNSYIVKSISGSSKGEYIPSQAFILDQNYFNDLFNKIITDIFPVQTIKALRLSTGFKITINTDGEVVDCNFGINSADLKIISDQDLQNVYNKFMNLRIDMTKIRFAPDGNNSIKYAQIGGSFLPLEYREKK